MTRNLACLETECAIAAAASAIVAIPAKNEGNRIRACLSALAMQRDRSGRPLPRSAFEVVLFANDCDDETADVAGSLTPSFTQKLTILRETSPPLQAGAGWARMRAMDCAAALLRAAGRHDGAILTTDADSCVAPDWVAETLAALAAGADCVAGYVDANPEEIVALGPAFLRRARLEDDYLGLLAEIAALCRPLPHDPWPNHAMTSGASLAVTLAAYEAVGGLAPLPLGEDGAFARALLADGFRIRHSLAVRVHTSCRLEGRAAGGAADTMRLRFCNEEAPCDADILPARQFLRRCRHSGKEPDDMFLETAPLRPADLPSQIQEAKEILSHLRGLAQNERKVFEKDPAL